MPGTATKKLRQAAGANSSPATTTGLETHYTLEEAAAISKRTPQAMRQLRVKGKGPRFVKVDGRLYVSASELQRWLSGQVLGSRSHGP